MAPDDDEWKYVMKLNHTGTMLSLATIAAVSLLSPSAHAQTTAAATPFTNVVLRNFATWDADHDGMLTVAEVENLVRNPKITGEDAAAVATLDMLARKTRTTAAPLVTKEYLTQYAADPHSATYPGYEKRFELCAKRIAATPNAMYTSPSAPQLKSVCQGMIGDCFFVSVVGAMLNRDPNQVRSMISQRPDGSSDVVFPAGQHAHVLPITDTEVALSGNSLGTGRWLATLESGFANIRRDMKKTDDAALTRATPAIAEPDPTILATDIIRTGGSMHMVIEFLTGHAIGHVILRHGGVKEMPTAAEQQPLLPAIRTGVSEALRDKRLVGTGTTLDARPKGISGDHAYAIVGYDAATDRITIWNPHGVDFSPKGEPGLVNGYPTVNGIFTMPLLEFAQVFEAVNWELNEPSKVRTLAAGTPETPQP